jgi:hypothetical protein
VSSGLLQNVLVDERVQPLAVSSGYFESPVVAGYEIDLADAVVQHTATTAMAQVMLNL